ncbi:hypothetical protein GOODEAATRI_006503 [Goodea atripinnis]|uniref:C2H2-type domain-containing protein n=1 Tax=Goodea atripinnis TaxID=208336 RepID=A0ABV0PVU1_9TELE
MNRFDCFTGKVQRVQKCKEVMYVCVFAAAVVAAGGDKARYWPSVPDPRLSTAQHPQPSLFQSKHTHLLRQQKNNSTVLFFLMITLSSSPFTPCNYEDCKTTYDKHPRNHHMTHSN